MRNQTAKKIRKIIESETPIGRRNYRRAKKIYSRLSEKAKPIFISSLESIFLKKESFEP